MDVYDFPYVWDKADDFEGDMHESLYMMKKNF